MTTIDRAHLARLLDRERVRYRGDHERSYLAWQGSEHLFGRVPMTWMSKWVGGFPLTFASAKGARITDVDGHDYIDFALGDTGAMAGHSPEPTVRAVTDRIATRGGLTTMLPSEDGEWVGAELSRRFGMAKWSFALSATDANRWAIRLARLVTGRPKILVFSYCYHGSVDETFIIVGPDGRPCARGGNVGPAVDSLRSTGPC